MLELHVKPYKGPGTYTPKTQVTDLPMLAVARSESPDSPIQTFNVGKEGSVTVDPGQKTGQFDGKFQTKDGAQFRFYGNCRLFGGRLKRPVTPLPAVCIFLMSLGLGACGTGPGQTIGCPETRQKASVAMTGIAFTKGTEIYVVKADGTDLRGLSTAGFYDNQPAWSRDGTRIAFSRSRSDVPDSKPQIYVMGPDGSGVRRLTCDNKYEDSPAWSPDGTRIAYSRTESDGRDSIVTMGADGSRPVAVVRYDSFDDSSIAWSPDGQHIAYTTKTGIVVIKPDGTGALQLTTTPFDSTVSWSPNSKWIAFTRGAANSSVNQIWVISAAGGAPRRITTSGSYGSPTWSPDGTKLAFASQPGKPSRIYVSNADGTQLHPITQPMDAVVNWVAWSPAA